jgi:hypothetical protein
MLIPFHHHNSKRLRVTYYSCRTTKVSKDKKIFMMKGEEKAQTKKSLNLQLRAALSKLWHLGTRWDLPGVMI